MHARIERLAFFERLRGQFGSGRDFVLGLALFLAQLAENLFLLLDDLVFAAALEIGIGRVAPDDRLRIVPQPERPWHGVQRALQTFKLAVAGLDLRREFGLGFQLLRDVLNP